MNKKGSSKVLSVYWFAVLVIVAGGVFAMVTAFYSNSYDIRKAEGEILSEKIADCISEEGRLNEGLFKQEDFSKGFSDNFLERCNLDFETSDGVQYYAEVSFYNLTHKNKPLFEISEGREEWKADCNIEEEHEKMAECVERRFYSVHNDEQYLIKILAIVGKQDKNV